MDGSLCHTGRDKAINRYIDAWSQVDREGILRDDIEQKFE